MKKLSKKVLEARMRDILNEPTPEDLERFEAMTERAHAEYLRRAQEEETKPVRHSARRYALTAALLALALIVLPVVYTALFPVTVSNANNLMRRAGIWINNTLRLGIEFPEPVVDDQYIGTPKAVGSRTFATVDELAAFLGENTLALDTNYPGLTLDSIQVTLLENDLSQVKLSYSYNGYSLALTYESILADVSSISYENSIELPTTAGTLFYWSTEKRHRAIGILSTWSVQLLADIEISNLKSLFKSLYWIN